MRAKSGGGITSNKLRQVYEPKTEPRAHKVNVDAAAMQGLTLGYERKPRDGKGYSQGLKKSMKKARKSNGHRRQ